MPITQDRMIDIIDTADTLASRLVSAANYARQRLALAEKDRDDPAYVLGIFSDVVGFLAQKATIPTSILDSISAEKQHFLQSKNKNERTKLATKRWRERTNRLGRVAAISGNTDFANEEAPEAIPKSKFIPPSKLPFEEIWVMFEDAFENSSEPGFMGFQDLGKILFENFGIREISTQESVVRHFLGQKLIEFGRRSDEFKLLGYTPPSLPPRQEREVEIELETAELPPRHYPSPLPTRRKETSESSGGDS